MNQSETNFYRWLIERRGFDPDKIEFQSNATPDFIGGEKEWEVKKLYRTSIILYSERQFEYIKRGAENSFLVIMPENPGDGDEPLFNIPCSEINIIEEPKFLDLEEYQIKENLPSGLKYSRLTIKGMEVDTTQVSVRIDADDIEWIDKMMEKEIFDSRSHALRRALIELRDEMETRGEPFG